MKKKIILATAVFSLVCITWAQINKFEITDAEHQEVLDLIHKYHLARGSLAYQTAVIQQMLIEANISAKQLKLPVAYPIQIGDIKDAHVSPPFYSRIENTNVTSSVERVRTAKIVVGGFIETTNFTFSFSKGVLVNICRMDNGENYINDEKLDKWQAMPSLIDSLQAHQLATQWLATMGVNMTALERLKWTTHQLRYLPRGATSPVIMPLFYVDFGSKHYHWPPGSSMKDFDEPLIEVKILGITKELMELRIGDESLSLRPQMIITNALELASIPDPPMKQMQRPLESQTNAPLSP